MPRGRIRRVILGDGRWVRPRAAAVSLLVLALIGVFAAEAAFLRWATSSYDSARTIAAAGSALRRPLRLSAALDVEWREALSAAASPGEWERLLAPPVPPAICPFGTPVIEVLAHEAATMRLADAVRALELAIRRDASAEELGRRIADLRAVGAVQPNSAEEFIVRYNLARGYLVAHDHAGAAEVIEPVFDGFLSRHRQSESHAALAFHARFLTGSIAYRRGEVYEAIKHFRLAINAVNYLVAEDSAAIADAAHFRRTPIPPPADCGGSRNQGLTSLDAYAALVAAYMAAPAFTDPTRLQPEVRRTRLQIDPDDPFSPVLRHARDAAVRPRSSPIPENLLWAASNLQRVYHHNRLEPDPRLAVTRAVLLLRLTSDTAWVSALARSGDTDVCGMLAAVGGQLEADATARALSRAQPLPTDHAHAAVAIHTFSRLARDCGRAHAPPLSHDVRSAWLRHSRADAGTALAGLYEEWRIALEDALRPANASEQAVAGAIAPVLHRIAAHTSVFQAGRVPADLPASTQPARGRRFAAAWRRAVFEDIADALADAGSASSSPDVRTVALSNAGLGGGRLVEIPAGRAPHFLASLNSAIAHAGLRPSQVYAHSELVRLARSGGTAAMLEYRVRYFVRSYPTAALVSLGGVFFLAAVVLLVLHVSWWRYRLLVSERLYAAESGQRSPGERHA
jgi:hypothetical protein